MAHAFLKTPAFMFSCTFPPIISPTYETFLLFTRAKLDLSVE